MPVNVDNLDMPATLRLLLTDLITVVMSKEKFDEAKVIDLVMTGHAIVQRRKNAAVRRANRIDKAIANLKREMIDHCRNPHGNGRHAELIRFDLAVLLAERDRLSRAVPTLDDELLEQLADDYDAADARKAAVKSALDGEADE